MDLAFSVLIVGFCLGFILMIAAIIVAVVGAVRRSSGAGCLAGWLFFLGAVLDLVTGAIIVQVLGAIGS